MSDRSKRLVWLAQQCVDKDAASTNHSEENNSDSSTLDEEQLHKITDLLNMDVWDSPIRQTGDFVNDSSIEVTKKIAKIAQDSNTNNLNEVPSASTYVVSGTNLACSSIIEEPSTPEASNNFNSDSDGDFSSTDSINDPSFHPISDTDNDSENPSANEDLQPEYEPVVGERSVSAVEAPAIRKKTRKRVRQEAKWAKNIRKEKRASGQEYTGRGGKVVHERSIRGVCNCKLKCKPAVTEEERNLVHGKFWSAISWDQRKQFIALSVKHTEIERTRPRNNKQQGRRKYSYKYWLRINSNKHVLVCKTMFLNTLSVSEKFVRNAIKHTFDGPGITTPDKIQNHPPTNKISEAARRIVKDHIQSFPVSESHYRRESSTRKYLECGLNIATMFSLYLEFCRNQNIANSDIVKASFYRYIFNTEFNYSFKCPQTDTCDDCDHYERLIQDCTNENDKTTEIERRDEHHREAKKRYTLKAADKERCKQENSKERVCMVDLQKCLPTPSLTNGRSFYLRKLWTLNLTVTDTTVSKTHCMIWNEVIGKRGSNEIASCILKWILALPHHVEEVTFWSDNCAGQNRNINLLYMYLWLLSKKRTLKVINHKHLLKGHTHMEVDIAHSIIERKRKHLKTMEVAVTHDWAQLIRMCSEKNPFQVYELSLEDFKDASSLGNGKNSPFVSRKLNESREAFKLSEAVHIQCVSTSMGICRYKTNFDKKVFKEINLIRCPRQLPLKLPDELPLVSKELHPISTLKYNNLMELLQWVPESCKHFFRSLPHSEGTDEIDD